MFSLKKKLLCFLFLLFFAVRAFAQNTGTVSGKLLDTIAHQSMGAATVELRYKKDSSVFGSQLANNDGSFSFNNVPLGNYLLTISFQGYRNIRRNVTLTPEVLNARLGNIYVRSNANELDAVTVVSSPPAVAVKSDTTEFGAGQYHVKPNSTTEDLIKKMPGIDVDQSGNIKAQGEQVQRVLVNGKRFFADDPKMATQNLPSDVIDKIQVFDDLSDQSKFSGMDDGNRVKTINIITRKEASVGYFGKIVGGGGGVISQGDNSGLYFTGAALHRFKGDQQLSVVAQANNTNQQMFTSQDILGTRGRGGQGGSFGSTPSGITRTFAGGLNYRDNWGKKTQVSGSYFYNNQRTLAGSSSVMESLSSDTALNNNQNSASNTINYTQNHRINFNLESNLDSMNALIFRPNFSTQSTNATGNSTTDIYRMNGMPVSHTDNASATKSNGYNGTVDAVFRHRFKKAGQTISADVSWTGSSNNNSGNYFNDIKYFDSAKANIIDSSKITNQQYTADSKSYTLSGTLSYTQPIAKNQQLELRYNHAYTNTVSNKTTYDFDSTTMA
ncbi:MAG: carboxypeptidase regulatory-like domain-containing protein, partial [Chitinophagaceae bacterium]|nr:carboxypeptidase regulatory-like domain-containing protein [Chitinophagaceae bacterium]